MKKVVVLAASVSAALALTAPAFAHFCFKTGWNETAAANAATSQAWLSADDYIAWLNSPEASFICPAGRAVGVAYFQSQPSTTLFMGPGLLAGGTLKNGKGNTPEQFGYLLQLFGQIELACTP